MVRGDGIGNEKLKIGELAEKSGITKRTIDYYTNLGLLKAERSTSNYRYYSTESIERLHAIEAKKAEGMSLEEIKKSLDKEEAKIEDIDVQDLRLQMQLLQKDVSKLLMQIDKQEQSTQQTIKKKISPESVALMQSLLMVIT